MRIFHIGPLLAASLPLSLPSALAADDASKALTPNDIVAAAPVADWVRIEPSDLVVMDLPADAPHRPRRVVIQLMPAPFSQAWVENIRRLAAARWYDGTAIVRVQDNYVVQWGDPDGEDAKKAKKLPPGLRRTTQADYEMPYDPAMFAKVWAMGSRVDAREQLVPVPPPPPGWRGFRDPYADAFSFVGGFPVGMTRETQTVWNSGPGTAARMPHVIVAPKAVWPIHCYGTVGVGRNLSPDAGTGAELYAVIGQAPRQLDRNIAVVGRIIAGIEHLSSLPRGTGALGFYETAAERTPIVSVRIGSDVPGLPSYEYLSTESASFLAYID